MFAVADRADCVLDACAGHTRCFNNDFDIRIGNQRIGVVGNERASLFMSAGKRRRRIHLIRPPGSFQLRPRATNVEVGDANKVHALRQSRLGHEHCAELARPYQADRHRSSGRVTLQ